MGRDHSILYEFVQCFQYLADHNVIFCLLVHGNQSAVTGSEDRMPDILVTSEFLGSSIPERLKKCRQLAAEAEYLAAGASTSGTEKAYLDLKRQWDELADQLAKAENERRQTGDI